MVTFKEYITESASIKVKLKPTKVNQKTAEDLTKALESLRKIPMGELDKKRGEIDSFYDYIKRSALYAELVVVGRKLIVRIQHQGKSDYEYEETLWSVDVPISAEFGKAFIKMHGNNIISVGAKDQMDVKSEMKKMIRDTLAILPKTPIIATNGTLRKLVKSEIDRYDAKYQIHSEYKVDLNHIDVSGVTDMSRLFDGIRVSFDISEWDVSKVRDMSMMFHGYIHNTDISKWDVSSVQNMTSMFEDSSFSSDISKWNVSKVLYMDSMFKSTDHFNGKIGNWNVSSVISMVEMFAGAYAFNQDLSKWNVRSVRDMSEMFADAFKFKQSGNLAKLEKWKVNKNLDTTDMFANYKNEIFDGIPSWALGDVKATNDTIYDLVGSEIKRLGNKADLNHIDVSKVTQMEGLFDDTWFNGDISKWDVSKVTDMSRMFMNSSFNGDISKWNVSKVTHFDYMFFGCDKFDQDLSKWNVSKGRDFKAMFEDSKLSKKNIEKLEKWKVNKTAKQEFMFGAGDLKGIKLPSWYHGK